MNKKTVRDIDLEGKRALVRVDVMVPFDPQTKAISDDSRIVAALPTIKYLIDKKSKVILCSHLGRPNGKVVEDMRLAPVARRLSELLKKPVQTTKDCIGTEVEEAVSKMKEGGGLM